MLRRTRRPGGEHRLRSPAPRARAHRRVAWGLYALAAALVVWSAMSLVATGTGSAESVVPALAIEGSDRSGPEGPAAPGRTQWSQRGEAATPPAPSGKDSRSPAGKKFAPQGTDYEIERPTPSVEPRAIRIPALGIGQPLIELSVNGTQLQVPSDYHDLGWWRDGPVPGERGAAVVVGHVDSRTGPAVFYRLSGMQPGQRIIVRLDDGSRRVFVVRKVVSYDRDKFPSKQVYRTRGKPALHLLTCGGSFDTAADRYRSNVVVHATLADRQPGAKESRSGAKRDTKEPKKGTKEPKKGNQQ